MKELEITDKQRQQFVEVVQEMQQKIEPLLKEGRKGGKPEEIRPRVMKIREEHVGRIEALSDAQILRARARCAVSSVCLNDLSGRRFIYRVISRSGKAFCSVKASEWFQPFSAFAVYLPRKSCGRWQSTQVAWAWWLDFYQLSK
jgi:hypothetical protein